MLIDQIQELKHLAHQLLYLGTDDTPIYADSLAKLNKEVKILDKISPSLLKCQLLTYCYGEVYDEELAMEAHSIIDSWGERRLSDEEQEIADTLMNLENYPYPWSEIKE